MAPSSKRNRSSCSSRAAPDPFVKAVFQRVASAEVRSEGRTTGRIGPGAVVLLGIGRTDTAAEAAKLADKVAKLRVLAA